MRLSPEIYTSQVVECQDFYLKYFNFKVKLEAEGFAVPQDKSRPKNELMLCLPNLPFLNSILHPEFNNKGIILQFEVNKIEDEYPRIKNPKIPILIELVEEPVNGKPFTISDPSG